MHISLLSNYETLTFIIFLLELSLFYPPPLIFNLVFEQYLGPRATNVCAPHYNHVSEFRSLQQSCIIVIQSNIKF